MLQRYADCWDTNKTYAKWFWELPAANQALLTSDVIDGSALLGQSSFIGKTGLFTLTPTLSNWFISGSGIVMSEGVVLSESAAIGE